MYVESTLKTFDMAVMAMLQAAVANAADTTGRGGGIPIFWKMCLSA